MVVSLASSAPNPRPSLASLIRESFPSEFLSALPHLIQQCYDAAAATVAKESSGLPYGWNAHPHDRNRQIFKAAHLLGNELGIQVISRRLPNAYHIPEFRSGRVKLQLKHQNPRERLAHHLTKADYRRQQAAVGHLYTQLFFEGLAPEPDGSDSDCVYVLMMFADSPTSKAEVGDIFFVVPSSTGTIAATADLHDVLWTSAPGNVAPAASAEDEDDFDLPSHADEDQQDQISS